MYQISDPLYKNKAAIEHHLFKQEQILLGLQETIILYKLTNTYSEGQCKANAHAAQGYSKEMRPDYPLVTLDLVLDSGGFPRRSQVYKGNVSEPRTLIDAPRSRRENNYYRHKTHSGHGCRHCYQRQYKKYSMTSEISVSIACREQGEIS